MIEEVKLLQKKANCERVGFMKSFLTQQSPYGPKLFKKESLFFRLEMNCSEYCGKCYFAACLIKKQGFMGQYNTVGFFLHKMPCLLYCFGRSIKRCQVFIAAGGEGGLCLLLTKMVHSVSFPSLVLHS